MNAGQSELPDNPQSGDTAIGTDGNKYVFVSNNKGWILDANDSAKPINPIDLKKESERIERVPTNPIGHLKKSVAKKENVKTMKKFEKTLRKNKNRATLIVTDQYYTLRIPRDRSESAMPTITELPVKLELGKVKRIKKDQFIVNKGNK